MHERSIINDRDAAEVQELLAGAQIPRAIEVRRADDQGNALFVYLDESPQPLAPVFDVPATERAVEADGEWRVLEANERAGRSAIARLEVRVHKPHRGFLRLAIEVTESSRVALRGVCSGGWLVLVPPHQPVEDGPKAALQAGLILGLRPSAALSRALDEFR